MEKVGLIFIFKCAQKLKNLPNFFLSFVVNLMLAQHMMNKGQMPAGLTPQQQQQQVSFIFLFLLLLDLTCVCV